LPLKTLQVAILGGNEDAVLVGLRNFPAHKLTLITLPDTLNQADSLAGRLKNTLKLTVEVLQVNDPSIPTMLETIARIAKNATDFQDLLINVGSANKSLTCAGITAAFVNGVKGFDVMNEQPIMLPIMKLSYTQIVSGPKLEILEAIQKAGGEVHSLEELAALSNFGKPLLSYHIRGSEEGQGLEALGLVEVERVKQGRLKVRLTSLGRILLSTLPRHGPAQQEAPA
jgi:hypothetical protein